MEDNELNMLLQELRNCLMPTHAAVEDMFNLTFDVYRPTYPSNGRGGFTTKWNRVDSNKRGALDDSFQRALYCGGNVNIEPDDSVTLKVDEQDKALMFAVKAVRNPMMRYRYLVVLCEPERRSRKEESD